MSDAPPEPEGDPPPEPEPQPDAESVRDPAQVLADNRRLGREAAAARKAAKDAEARIAELEKASMTDLERRIAEERLTAADEERSKWEPVVRELTLSKAAVGKLAEPELAGQLLAKQDIDLHDHNAVVAAIDKLLEEHPSLAPGPGQPQRSFDQGARSNGVATGPKTINDQLLETLGIKRSP